MTDSDKYVLKRKVHDSTTSTDNIEEVEVEAPTIDEAKELFDHASED